MYGENKGEAGGRKKECLREKWVGGMVEVVGRKDLFNSETPSHTTRPQRRKRRGTPNLNLEIDRRLRTTEALCLHEDRDPQYARSHKNLDTQAFCGCPGRPSLYTKWRDNREA